MTSVSNNANARQYDDDIENFRELNSLICGELLGQGVSRSVYVNRLDPETVIKWEKKGFYQNIIEWEIWQAIRAEPISQWFAPCWGLSTNGVFLVQSRVSPIPESKYPARLPSFMADARRSNLGMYRNRIVCCDYGASLARYAVNSKLVPVKWNKHAPAR